MNRDQVVAIFGAEIGRIAPEIPFDDVDRTEDLRDAFEIDSMDFLNLVTALHKRLGVEIPETDYAKLHSVDAAVDYLVAQSEGAT
ncbi:MAG: acyl carrier protein [Pseudomonadota bacterium]